MNERQVRIALLQDTARGSQEEALRVTLEKIREAAEQGAKIICTQELFLTEYFCRIQDPDFFDLAQPIPGPVTERFAEAAKKYDKDVSRIFTGILSMMSPKEVNEKNGE